jgi:uncharacterized protein (TIGR02145 family)
MRKIITKAIALLIAFSTATLAQEKGTFTDPRDKKKYKTVKIGEQVWMAENLNYNAPGSKCYGEGSDALVYRSGTSGVVRATLPKTEIQANCTKYGKLYDWETAMKACPKGWYLPRNRDWDKLFSSVGDKNTAGKHLKAKSGWYKYVSLPGNELGNGTDTYGFSALPGGSGDGNFSSIGINGSWWSATTRILIKGDDYISSNNTTSGLISIRCIQGDEEEALKIDAEEKAEWEAKAAEARAAYEKAQAEAAAKKKIEEEKAKAEREAYIKANGGTFTDTRDKKTYKTIKINGQVWLAENLNYAVETSKETSGTKCYQDSTTYCDKYGKLYNWFTAMDLPFKCNSKYAKDDKDCTIKTPHHKGICPAGWHLPKNAEWDKLYRSADGTSGTESPYNSQTAGKFLKSANGWFVKTQKGEQVDWSGTDKFGFSALPGGRFSYVNIGNDGFRYINGEGYWWSAEKNYDYNYVLYRIMNTGDGASTKGEDYHGSLYYSVRCIKD